MNRLKFLAELRYNHTNFHQAVLETLETMKSRSEGMGIPFNPPATSSGQSPSPLWWQPFIPIFLFSLATAVFLLDRSKSAEKKKLEQELAKASGTDVEMLKKKIKDMDLKRPFLQIFGMHAVIALLAEYIWPAAKEWTACLRETPMNWKLALLIGLPLVTTIALVTPYVLIASAAILFITSLVTILGLLCVLALPVFLAVISLALGYLAWSWHMINLTHWYRTRDDIRDRWEDCKPASNERDRKMTRKEIDLFIKKRDGPSPSRDGVYDTSDLLRESETERRWRRVSLSRNVKASVPTTTTTPSNQGYRKAALAWQQEKIKQQEAIDRAIEENGHSKVIPSAVEEKIKTETEPTTTTNKPTSDPASSPPPASHLQQAIIDSYTSPFFQATGPTSPTEDFPRRTPSPFPFQESDSEPSFARALRSIEEINDTLERLEHKARERAATIKNKKCPRGSRCTWTTPGRVASGTPATTEKPCPPGSNCTCRTPSRIASTPSTPKHRYAFPIRGDSHDSFLTPSPSPASPSSSRGAGSRLSREYFPYAAAWRTRAGEAQGVSVPKNRDARSYSPAAFGDGKKEEEEAEPMPNVKPISPTGSWEDLSKAAETEVEEKERDDGEEDFEIVETDKDATVGELVIG